MVVVISGSAFFGLKIPSTFTVSDDSSHHEHCGSNYDRKRAFALVLMLPIGFLIELFLEFLGIIFSFL